MEMNPATPLSQATHLTQLTTAAADYAYMRICNLIIIIILIMELDLVFVYCLTHLVIITITLAHTYYIYHACQVYYKYIMCTQLTVKSDN